MDTKLIKKVYRNEGRLPPEIAKAPKLSAGLLFYYDSFLDLQSERSIGEILGPIPWSAIEYYAERFNLQNEQYTRFHELIRAMDDAYLTYHRPKPKPQFRGKK